MMNSATDRAKRTVRGVIFDLDGTLFSLGALKLRVTLALWQDRHILKSIAAARAAVRHRLFLNVAELRCALDAELAQRCGLLPEQAGTWYEERYLGEFIRILGKHGKPRPGLLPLLDLLRERQVRLAVVSDVRKTRERLDALGIGAKRFDDVLCTEDFGALKPSAKALCSLAEQWNLNPAVLTVVGDRRDLDQAAAKSAGMNFVGVRTHWPMNLTGSEFFYWPKVVKRLKEDSEL